MTLAPDISVVVCTCNRAEMLRDALLTLGAQQTENRFRYEILVVDNASTDHTQQVIHQASASCGGLVRGAREPRPGRVYARNRGIGEARGQWIANFDDDQLAEPDWLLELFDLAHRRSVRSVGGVVRLRLPDDCTRQLSPVCRRLLGESNGWDIEQPYSRKEGPGSGNQLLHRSVFDEVGHYDEVYGRRGEDTDFYRRLRAARIESWYSPRAVVWHVTPAQRLEEAYLRATSQNNGWCFARRDQVEWGRVALASLSAARCAQAGLVHGPRYLWARVTCAHEELLSARCLFWRMQGYLRATAEALFVRGLARD